MQQITTLLLSQTNASQSLCHPQGFHRCPLHDPSKQKQPCRAHRQRARVLAAAAAAAAAGSARQRAVTAAAAQPQQQQQQQLQELPVDVDPQELLANLSRTTSYTQLSAFVRSQHAVFLRTPLCVYALLHAVQLRDTLAFDRMGQGSLASEEAVLQQLDLVEQLLDDLCRAALPHVPALPLLSQAALALALAQLEYYEPDLVSALTESVKATLAQPQPADDDSAALAGSSTSSSGQQPPEAAAALAELPEGLVSGVLLSMAVACSLNGHYDEALLDRVAQQAVVFKDALGGPGPLISIAAALLDLQHDHPPLLTAAAAAAAAAAAEREGALQPEEVISLLLALGFFRVPAPAFVQSALQALGDAGEQLCELEAVQLSRLWKALLLLREDGVTPPEGLVQALCYAADQLQEQQQDEEEQGEQDAAADDVRDMLLLGSCQGSLLLTALQGYQSSLSAAGPSILQGWEEAGMLAALPVLNQLQELGFKLEQGAEVSASAHSQGSAGGQQQQELPAAQVDLSFVWQDPKTGEQRRVAVVLLFSDRYCNSPRNRLRGAAAVEILALQALGLSVLPLPLQDWQALGDNTSQQRYLKARVAAATM